MNAKSVGISVILRKTYALDSLVSFATQSVVTGLSGSSSMSDHAVEPLEYCIADEVPSGDIGRSVERTAASVRIGENMKKSAESERKSRTAPNILWMFGGFSVSIFCCGTYVFIHSLNV